MAYTQHYNLPLTADSESSKKFLDWRKEVNGTSEDSAMNKIDGILFDLSNELQPATPSKDGLMSAGDKTNLDRLDSNITITETGGVAAGAGASATAGGAVGAGAAAGAGFAAGQNAKAIDENNHGIDAIQLGTGQNITPKTLQVYDYQLMDADGKIPAERLTNTPVSSDIQAQLDLKSNKQNSDGGFSAGNGASTVKGASVGTESTSNWGGAIGYKASTFHGGAVGQGAHSTGGGAVGMTATTIMGGSIGSSARSKDGGAIGCSAVTNNGGAIGLGAYSGDGFAGGMDAIAAIISENGRPTLIDAIQLGTGQNITPKTLQVYDHQLMDADGNIPAERLVNTPVSSAIQQQLNLKANLTGLISHIDAVSNPHDVTAYQVGAYTKAEADAKYATKTDIGNINSVLDAINGAVI